MAMKSKHQRLILALLALVAVVAAGLLAASALKDEAAYFYTPEDALVKGVEPGKAIRLGGMVVKGSLKKAADGVTIRFDVTAGPVPRRIGRGRGRIVRRPGDERRHVRRDRAARQA